MDSQHTMPPMYPVARADIKPAVWDDYILLLLICALLIEALLACSLCALARFCLLDTLFSKDLAGGHEPTDEQESQPLLHGRNNHSNGWLDEKVDYLYQAAVKSYGGSDEKVHVEHIEDIAAEHTAEHIHEYPRSYAGMLYTGVGLVVEEHDLNSDSDYGW
ncbi:hypothetical protein GE09DRAFT_80063 [Coniochaeta sp. 2T2.1]|nr:hypothetical protein GE09DRAFT_80063 [Coniochaeta sp. 2T2.1]